ncbi:MAG: cytidylate kinase-like family protein [Acidobacteriaceae bacterium]|nr:cytidylate kinase-like family protein [Acidobacteriaceae bacterium]
MTRIITIEREYGSGAAAIARKLAERLAWTLWDRDITCDIARRLKCKVEAVEKREERPDPAFYRLVKAFMRGSYEDSMAAGNVELLDAEHLAKLFEKVVNDAASKGNCVIVGRGAPYFLRDRDDVFSVFMYAPHHEKIRRITEAQGKTVEEAEELVERVDRERAAFVKKYFDRIWPQRDLYDMMINTRIGDDAVIEMVLHEIELLERLPIGATAGARAHLL